MQKKTEVPGGSVVGGSQQTVVGLKPAYVGAEIYLSCILNADYELAHGRFPAAGNEPFSDVCFTNPLIA
jgi:hypothetical protein